MSDKKKVEIKIIWAHIGGDRVGTVKRRPEIALVASRYAWVVYWHADGTKVPFNESGFPSGRVHAKQVILPEHLKRYGRRTGNYKISPLGYAMTCAENRAKSLLK